MNKSSKTNNNMENQDIHIDYYLNSIERVTAPPFLMTRIRQQLAHHVEKVPAVYVWIGALSLCVLLSLNLMILLKSGSGRTNDERHVLANSISYLSNNNIYR
jgi:hypothetical protein